MKDPLELIIEETAFATPIELKRNEGVYNTTKTFVTRLVNDTNCQDDSSDSWLTGVFVPVTYILIFVIGVVGNGLVVWLMVKKDKRGTAAYQRSVTNLYVLNLAIADLIFVGFLPFWTADKFSGGNWLFGAVGCKLLTCITLLNLYGSVFFLVGMGIDRYIAIVFALRAQSHRTRKNATRACIVIWILASLVACQTLVLRKVSNKKNCPGKFICHWDFYDSILLRDAYFVLRSGLGFFIPFIVILFCYVFIFVSLKRRNKRTAKNGMRIPEHKISRLILWVIGMFVVCWLPNHVVNVIYAVAVSTQDTSYDYNLIKQAYSLTSCLAYANSSCNPILYAFMKDDIRTQVVALAAKCFGYRTSQTDGAFSEASSPFTRDTKDLDFQLRSRKNERDVSKSSDGLTSSPATPQTTMNSATTSYNSQSKAIQKANDTLAPPMLVPALTVATTCGTVSLTSEIEAKTTLL